MSNLMQQLTEDMKQAMRDRDSLTLNTVRFLLSAIKNHEIDHGELDDAGIQSIISKQVKLMKDALSDFQRGGRQDLVDAETQKISILEAYLPAQMSDEELQKIIEATKAENPDLQTGQLIGKVMPQVHGQADGKRVSAMVQSVMAV